MKLLSKSSATAKIKKDNDELVDTNIRLRKFWQDIVKKINTAKDDYEPEKITALKAFEAFTRDLMEKKSKLLQELQGITAQIEQKKELYYGLIAKQDALDEKLREMAEQDRKLTLREAFVTDLETKFREQNAHLHE